MKQPKYDFLYLGLSSEYVAKKLTSIFQMNDQLKLTNKKNRLDF